MKKFTILLAFLLLLIGCGRNKKAAKDPDVYYICSMDPLVISDKPGKCPICKMELTPVRKNGNKQTGGDELQLSDQQIQLGNIKTDTIRQGEVGSQQVLTGTLNFDQSKRASVSARVMGRVERLYFKNIGDYVSKGAPLYELYSEDLNNAKQEYILALERRKLFTDESVIDFDDLIQSAHNKLRLWGMTEGQIKALSRTNKPPLITTFYSNESGYITELGTTEGAYVMEGGIIVQLANLSSLWAEAQVYSSQLSTIAPNSIATVQVPGSGTKEIKGRIAFANPEISSNSRINLVRVPMPNSDGKLKPGMPAIILLNFEYRSTLTLPVDAVIREANTSTVWVATTPNTFRNQMVTLGKESDNQIEITSGVKAGDVVVTSGANLLNSEFIFKRGANPMAGHNH
jgi:membrane fusion protein, copper/silver efflux system